MKRVEKFLKKIEPKKLEYIAKITVAYFIRLREKIPRDSRPDKEISKTIPSIIIGMRKLTEGGKTLS